MRALLIALVVCLIAPGPMSAQQAPQQPAPAPGGAPGGAPSPNVPGRDTGPQQPGRDRGPGFEQPGQQQRQGQFEQRPIFLSGKVMLDDGTPPPEPVTIERVCGGYVRPEAYTDSKGRFSFQVGAQNNVLMDASVSSGAGGRDPLNPSGGGIGGFPSTGGGGSMGSGSLGMVDMMGCELRASLAGFRSENVILTRRSMFDNPDVGTIILRRLANVPGTAISFTTLAAPKEAKKSFEKAQKLLQQKSPRHAEAAKELERAVQLYPQYAAAWYQLGEAKLALKDEEGARKAFEQSLSADAKYVNPYMKLAMIELRASRWTEAADVTKQLALLNPMMGQVHYFNAIANFNLGKMELAEKSVRSAMKSEEAARIPQAHHLLGTILARQGNFPSAADELRTFLKLAPASSTAEQVRKQLAEWEGLGVIPRPEAPKN